MAVPEITAPWWKRWLLERTGGDPVFPLSVLFLLYFFDEFDTGAFNVLAPNIKKSFDLTTSEFGTVVVVNLGIVLLLAVPVGHFGDRVKRVGLVVIGAIVAGLFSFLTGVVTTVALLFLVRLGNGMGRLVNDPIHTSLLTDYYKPFDRPRVFAVHRNAVQLGNIFGAALAGLAAYFVGWRLAFMVLIVPILITAIVATRLTEPRRGGTDETLAHHQAHVAHVPFRKAIGLLVRIKTLRRAYWGVIALGGGIVPLAVLVPLYLDEVYQVNEAWRGVLVSANGVATFIGLMQAGNWTTKWMAKNLGEPLRKVGVASAAVGIELTLAALAPNLAAFIVVSLVTSYTVGIFLPPVLTVQALVAPARVRSLAFSFAAIFIVLGGAVFFLSPLGRVTDTYGAKWGLFSSAPCWALAGLILASAWKFVTDDTTQAMQEL